MIVFGALALCGCNNEKEVPPYQKTLNTEFVMPKPKPLTAGERAWLKEHREEYNNSIKEDN